jgi:hypothetical protein
MPRIGRLNKKSQKRLGANDEAERLEVVTIQSSSFEQSDVSPNSFRPSSFTIGIVRGFFDSIDFRTKQLNYLGKLFYLLVV